MFEEMKHEAISEADEKSRLSRKLVSELDRLRESYGDV